MGWLSKIFGGSSHSHIISKGQYHGRCREDTVWDGPTTSSDALSDYDNEDIDRAIALSLVEQEEIQIKQKEEHIDHKGKKVMAETHECQVEEDEELAKALQESLNIESPVPTPPRSPPKYDRGSMWQPYPPPFLPYGLRTCAGCKAEIGHGRYMSCMGGFWHPECFR